MEKLISRLDNILEGLTGCRLTYIPVEEITRSQWADEQLEGYLHGSIDAATSIRDLSGESVGFPVRRSGQFAGLAVMTGWDGSDEAKLNDMAEFVTAMIEKELASADRTEFLRRSEEQLGQQLEAPNVIPLRMKRASVTSLPVLQTEATAASIVPALLVQYKEGFPIKRVALEVHERSGRWVFISSNDLAADALSSSGSIAELGGATLFIEDLASLPLESQRALAAYAAETPTEDAPIIFAAVTESPEELVERGVLLKPLCEALAFTRLIWNPQDDDAVVVRASARLLLDTGEGTATQNDLSKTRFVPFHESFLDLDNPPVH